MMPIFCVPGEREMILCPSLRYPPNPALVIYYYFQVDSLKQSWTLDVDDMEKLSDLSWSWVENRDVTEIQLGHRTWAAWFQLHVGFFFWSLTDEIRPCRSRISNENDLSAHRRPVCFPSSVNSWERQNSVKIVFTRLKYYKNRQFKWMNEWIMNKASIVHIQKEVKSKSRIIKETIPSPYANQ